MTSSLWSIVLAAGQGSRLAEAAGNTRKQFLSFGGRPLYWRSIMTLAAIPAMRGLVVVFPEAELEARQREIAELRDLDTPGVPIICAIGGQRRQDSVRLALASVPKEIALVLVHDSARPFFSAALVQTMLNVFEPGLGSVIPGIAVKDTVKLLENGLVQTTLDRSRLTAVQTPQLFPAPLLRHVHEQALQENWNVTDDASMIELAGHPVLVVPGEETNTKITTPEDLRLLETPTTPARPCTGFGYDVHAYGGNRPMVLGGMPIPGAPLIKAHSDGDVLLHALTDAILGCVGLGDIGEHFPDSNQQFDNISSAILLSQVFDKSRALGLAISHVDMTIIAQVPKISPHKEAIRKNVARLLELADEQVNVKATTEEHLGFTGRKEGIKAVAIVTGTRKTA